MYGSQRLTNCVCHALEPTGVVGVWCIEQVTYFMEHYHHLPPSSGGIRGLRAIRCQLSAAMAGLAARPAATSINSPVVNHSSPSLAYHMPVHNHFAPCLLFVPLEPLAHACNNRCNQ